MDINTITTLIGNFGFPVVACLAMGWYMKYNADKHREQLKENNDRYDRMIDKVLDTVENNTSALKKLEETITNNLK